MKNILTFLFAFAMFASVSQAQEDTGFTRDGKILVETGYNIVGGFTSGSGVSTLTDFDGGSLTAIAFDGGKFLSENFAMKFKFSLLSGQGLSLTNFAGGVKYYIGGVVPVELTAGLGDTGNQGFFTGNLRFGYAARLADNIALEPTIGLLVLEDSGALNFGVNFAMFL